MKWPEFVVRFGDQAVLETGMLLGGGDRPAEVQRQLSRWTRAGKLIQLRRGVYLFASPRRGSPPHPFLVANRLRFPSYVSLESSLSYHGVIPEHTVLTTSVTTRRPQVVNTPVGEFSYRHLHRSLFFGYEEQPAGDGSRFLVALPEKALLDLIHLTPGGATPEYLEELRLGADLNADLLESLAEKSGKPKLNQAARRVRRMLRPGRIVV